MTSASLVLADTSVWVDYFRRRASPSKPAMNVLLRTNRVAMAGPVLAEILTGARDPEHERFLKSHLDALPWLDAPRSVWELAGGLGAKLRRQGVTLPASDLQIAAIASFHRVAVYTIDEHFRRVPGLALYAP